MTTTVRAETVDGEPDALPLQLPEDTVLAVIIRRDAGGYLLAVYEALPELPPDAPGALATAPIMVSRPGDGTLRETTIRALKWLLERL